MYTDHKKGINQDHADKARLELFIRNKKVPYEFRREFDEYGDVKRNHVKEAEIFAEDELENLIPQADGDYFQSFQNFHLHLKRNADKAPDVQSVPQLPRVKVQPPPPLMVRLLSQLKSPYPRLTFVLRSLW